MQHRHPLIRRLAENLCKHQSGPQQCARALAAWTRSQTLQIPQQPALWPAATALQINAHDSLNKAHVLVSLLRNRSIAAGFVPTEVPLTQLFGAAIPPRLLRLLPRRLFYVEVSAHIAGQWQLIDANIDETLHVALTAFQPHRIKRETQPVPGMLPPSRSEVFAEVKASPNAVDVDALQTQDLKNSANVAALSLNVFLDFCRKYALTAATTTQFHAQFFHWLEQQHPVTHTGFLQLEREFNSNTTH